MVTKIGIVTLLLVFGYTLQRNEYDSSSEESENSRENTTQRIVGGYEAEIEEFPWQVSIAFKGRHNCGGSILSKNYILTAAHCTNGLPLHPMKVRVGSSYRDRGGSVYTPIAVHVHPKYNASNFHYDISILKLNTQLKYTSNVQPITLPKPKDPDPKPGVFATVSGFGQLSVDNKTMSCRLRAVSVPIIARGTCKKRYRSFLVDETMLCTENPKGGKDACAGDSGGPLTINKIQIGIVSWGISCASPKHPGVFASVKNLLSFISKILREK